MNHLTIGVAGHIDHGKTALVRALTGMETDRLAEEQARGMSIALGFAYLALPGGMVDFIDVPGHEKFVRTMISGATGIDAALLVVAANERVKPQTVEHVALMELLGVSRGLVAVTKSDLLPDRDDRELAAEELRAFLGTTFLRNAPLVFTSTLTGEGVEEVKSCLDGLLHAAIPLPVHPYFSLPVDRAFTIVGAGTVATGTLRRGQLRVGQMVEIFPGGALAEVRGLEVHNQAVAVAEAGWRTAVNLRGVKREELARGDLLVTPGVFQPSRFVDVELRLLPEARKPLKRGQSLQSYFGAGESLTSVYPLDRDQIAPGETCLAQLRFVEPVVMPIRERFILRTLSPAETVGGGVVIDPNPVKHGRVESIVWQRVQTIAYGSPSEKILAKLAESGAAGQSLSRLRFTLGLEDADTLLAFCVGDLALHPNVFADLCAKIRESVGQFHADNPTKQGISREVLRRRLPRDLNPAVYGALLDTLVQRSELELRDGLVRESGFSSEGALSDIEREIAAEIETCFRLGGLKPPRLEDALQKDRRRKNLYHYLVDLQRLIPMADRAIVFHADALEQAKDMLAHALANGQGLTVSELNIVLNTTRKFAIPLLEYLDSLGVTRRVGDLRVWNEGDLTLP